MIITAYSKKLYLDLRKAATLGVPPHRTDLPAQRPATIELWNGQVWITAGNRYLGFACHATYAKVEPWPDEDMGFIFTKPLPASWPMVKDASASIEQRHGQWVFSYEGEHVPLVQVQKENLFMQVINAKGLLDEPDEGCDQMIIEQHVLSNLIKRADRKYFNRHGGTMCFFPLHHEVQHGYNVMAKPNGRDSVTDKWINIYFKPTANYHYAADLRAMNQLCEYMPKDVFAHFVNGFMVCNGIRAKQQRVIFVLKSFTHKHT